MPKIEKHKVEERSTSFNMKLLENIKIQCNCQPRTSSEKKCLWFSKARIASVSNNILRRNKEI